MAKSNIKQNLHAFKVANKTLGLVKKFNKEFLNALQNEPLEDKLKMYALCIKYMKESFDKKLG